ncbi:mediator of RNA polymerase II transcription subunit 17-like [Clytia hemisphaerica]|uniref:Mediator of RNA polymerase II transcription subunit 17 n=2 Tax=Clytia hemisphaerica TaxID=252671 RepID=A0A7M5X0Y8_9CNID
MVKTKSVYEKMAMKSVNISVERLLEQEVEVIGRDGEEKYIKPFDFSEELTYLAGKIDFYEGIDGHTAAEEEENEEEEESLEEGAKKENDSKQENEWPWSSVHSKLRLALTEMCVMLDVLQTLNKRKYFILAPIQQNPELEKQTVQMLEKRKYLAKVGSYIGTGAAGLGMQRHVKPEPIIIDSDPTQEKEIEYYTQLMELRQFWRVKKSGNQITGDLSYRTSGSRFWHPGIFEVKAESDEAETEEEEKEEKKLAITLSPDLVKSSHIIVQLIDKESRCGWKAVSHPIILEDNFVNSWEKEMTKAQQHLFNKEIFSQLSNDAFQGSFLGINVLNSQIRCTMSDNAEVIITHNVDSATTDDLQTETKETSNDLALLLSALLYQQHRNVSKFSTPYPATSNFYGKQSKSSSVINIIHRKPNDLGKSILYEFMKQAEHKLWIHRINEFLYNQNVRFPEPSIGFHWNVLKSRLKSMLTVTLSTVHRHKSISSNFAITVDETGFHISSRNMISVDLPFDMDMLALVLSNNVYKHLQSVVQDVSRQHGWIMITPKMGNNILSSNQVQARPPLLLRNDTNEKFVQIYLNDMRNIEVEISKERQGNDITLDDGFKLLNKEKLSVSWALLPGDSFMEKCEFLFLFL